MSTKGGVRETYLKLGKAVSLLTVHETGVTPMLRRALTYEGYEVTMAHDGKSALRECAMNPPSLVVLDWMLPEMTGIEVCRRIRDEGELPILMLTAKDAVDDRVLGLETGADDYLVKPFALEELLARVKALFRRTQPSASTTLTFEDITLDRGSRTVRRGEREVALSTTEFNLLHLFMENPRQVLTRESIMDAVWGYDFEGESNVLEVYVGYLRRKLEEGGMPRVLHTVRGVGYALRDSTIE